MHVHELTASIPHQRVPQWCQPLLRQGYWSDEGEEDPGAGLPRPAIAGSGCAPVLPPGPAARGASCRSMDLSGFGEELMLSPSPPVSVATSATTATTLGTTGTAASQQQQQQQQAASGAGLGHTHGGARQGTVTEGAAAAWLTAEAGLQSHHHHHHHQQQPHHHQQQQQPGNVQGVGLPSSAALAWVRGSSSGKQQPSSSPTFAAVSAIARRRDSFDPLGALGSHGGGGSYSHAGSGTGMSHTPHHGSLASSLKPALVRGCLVMSVRACGCSCVRVCGCAGVLLRDDT